MGWRDWFDVNTPPITPLGVRKEAKSFTVNFVPEDEAERLNLLPRTRFDYAGAVRGGLDSNVVMAPIQWIMRTFPEAELVAQRKRGELWREVNPHPLVDRVARPNPFYDGATLLQATALSYFMDGNAYWLKVRNRFGEPVELWWVPHWLLDPKWDRHGDTFITHYEYKPDGRPIELPPSEVVHFRFGLDPKNQRKGLSPLRALMREVFTDDEAANFSASILRNHGIPGVVIAPKDMASAKDPEDIKATKRYVESSFTGDRRGKPMVLGAPTEVKSFGFNPNELMLGNIRDIAEERVCAALGLPAAVVGFGTGLQQTKVGATMREMRRLAWLSCIIPSQNVMARQLSAQLLPDFEGTPELARVRFDSSGVAAFQEDETERAQRIIGLVESGMLRVDRGQEMVGIEADPSQAIYLRPTSVTAVTPDGEPVSGDGEVAAFGGRLKEIPTGNGKE